jgi:hypothetical protein
MSLNESKVGDFDLICSYFRWYLELNGFERLFGR